MSSDMHPAASQALMQGKPSDKDDPTIMPSFRSLMRYEQVETQEDLLTDVKHTWLRTGQAALFRAFMTEFCKKHVEVVSANGYPPDATNLASVVKTLSMEIRSGAASTRSPSWLFVFASDTLDPKDLLDQLKINFPECVNLHVSTTFQGVTSDTGFKVTKCADGVTRALSLLAVYDPLGTFSTVGIKQPPKNTNFGNEETFKAFDDAYMKLRAQAPDIMKDPRNDSTNYPCIEPLAEQLNIVMTPLYGEEERWLVALYDWSHQRFAMTVPITGGSAGDEGLAGTWKTYCQQATGERVFFDETVGLGCVFTFISASVKLFPCYMHAFTPIPDLSATVVTCGNSVDPVPGETSGRILHYLQDSDGEVQPAGSLYKKWVEARVEKKALPEPKVLDKPVALDAEVLGSAGIAPIGVNVARDGDDAFDYRILCPVGLFYFPGQKNDAFLQLAAEVAEGDEITLFKIGRQGDFLNRMGKLKEQLITQIDRGAVNQQSVALSPELLKMSVAGGFVVYCAGCTCMVNCGKDAQEQMRRLTLGLSDVFGGRPFTALHTMGEQMFYPSTRENHQVNLSFTLLVFSKIPCVVVDESRSFVDMIKPILKMFGPQEVDNVLQALLQQGWATHFPALENILRTNIITPKLLQDITPCCSKPLVFALRCAEMFHFMARRYPLKARDYTLAEAWFKKFGKDFLQAAPMYLIAKSNCLDIESIKLCVIMAMRIESKECVASNRFQEIMEMIWNETPEPDEAIKKLLQDTSMRRSWSYSPRVRHWLNTFSYLALTVLQAYTTWYCPASMLHWCLITSWSLANLLQTVASPTTGFFTILTTLDDVVLVIMHVLILRVVQQGQNAPPDLAALTMILHFGNMLKALTPQPQVGPLIILVMTMMGDISKVMFMLLFFTIGFYFSFEALYTGGVTGTYVGEDWTNSGVILMNAMFGPQVLWASDAEGSGNLFYSQMMGSTDAHALDVVGGLIIGLTVFFIPILLLNLLIAMMASTYSEVSAHADEEYKRTFASCVLVARELPWFPMPLSIPFDIVRICKKLTSSTFLAGMTKDADPEGRQEMAVSQLVQLWENYVRVEKAKSAVTLEQDYSMRHQLDGLRDRLNVVYNALLNLSIRVAKIEHRNMKAARANDEHRRKSVLA